MEKKTMLKGLRRELKQAKKDLSRLKKYSRIGLEVFLKPKSPEEELRGLMSKVEIKQMIALEMYINWIEGASTVTVVTLDDERLRKFAILKELKEELNPLFQRLTDLLEDLLSEKSFKKVPLRVRFKYGTWLSAIRFETRSLNSRIQKLEKLIAPVDPEEIFSVSVRDAFDRREQIFLTSELQKWREALRTS